MSRSYPEEITSRSTLSALANLAGALPWFRSNPSSLLGGLGPPFLGYEDATGVFGGDVASSPPSILPRLVEGVHL